MTLELTRGDVAIDPLLIADLRVQLSGELLDPEESGYDEARRLVNARYNQRPALIARCQSAGDVAAAVRFATAHGLTIAVRSGGHSLAGHSTGDGVLLIDLSQMDRIAIDPDSQVAHVQPGATNGMLVEAAAAHGLATTTGTCATVGMGGSTLGGGIGWLMGRFGATVDNVLACEIVTADGQIRTASASQHPDLFWALRGGGGNFGVVTRISYRLHPLGPVLGGPLVFPLAAAPLALRMYHQLASNAPDELISHAVLATLPEFGPALIIQAVYSGADLAAGERLLEPLRRFGPPAIDLIATRSYHETYLLLTPPMPPTAHTYETAYSLRQPSEAALDDLLATALERPSPFCAVLIHQVHGAATRVPADATAFALREPHYAIINLGMWLEGSGAAETEWAWHASAKMRPHASQGVYVNFLHNEGEAGVRAAYRANYARLSAIKAEYDPQNHFRRNQNITPKA